MEGAVDIPPPLQQECTAGRSHLRRTPFQFLNSDAFAIFFLTMSLCFILIVLVSPFYSFSFSFSFSFLKPHSSARKGWDFLSLALVLFAIACGLLSKNHGENTAHEEVYRATTSNVSQQNQKSNPSTPNQWPGYSDRTGQILLHHPSEVAGIEYWRLSGGNYITNCQSLSSGSLQHCRNLLEFEEELDVKRGTRATFSVYDEEISSSSSALHQFSVPPLMTPPRLSSPPMRIPPPRAVVEAEIERIYEGDGNFEPPPFRLDFQASEDEICKNEKQRDSEGKESKSKKKKKKKRQWKKGVENFNEYLAPQQRHRNISPPPVLFYRHQTFSKIGETRKDFPAPPQSPQKKIISVKTQRSTGGQPTPIPLAPPSTAAELQIEMEGEYLGTRNENAERNNGMLFCGSPDVNSKADNFIERFRAGLKLERMNSIKERQRKTRTSILGRQSPQL